MQPVNPTLVEGENVATEATAVRRPNAQIDELRALDAVEDKREQAS